MTRFVGINHTLERCNRGDLTISIVVAQNGESSHQTKRNALRRTHQVSAQDTSDNVSRDGKGTGTTRKGTHDLVKTMKIPGGIIIVQI